jgi:hypothetical protein
MVANFQERPCSPCWAVHPRVPGEYFCESQIAGRVIPYIGKKIDLSAAYTAYDLLIERVAIMYVNDPTILLTSFSQMTAAIMIGGNKDPLVRLSAFAALPACRSRRFHISVVEKR